MKKYLIVILIILAGSFMWWQDRQSAKLNRYKDLVTLTSPTSGEYISSPVKIEGKARGTWFFEATFPIVIVDWEGLIIGQGIAQAQSDWMTMDYVPFLAEVIFTKPTVKNNGWIILRRDNPSGLSQNDDAFEVPIFFR
jgi:hypothetical protein